MPRVIPFAALRPAESLAALVAAVPYDVVSTDEAREIAGENEFSFLHVDKAEIDVAINISPYSPEVYVKARENLEALSQKGALIKDKQPCLYIYRLSVNGKSQTGLACCVSVSDYERGVIKKHELTRPDKEKDRTDHVLACRAHTGPIFMAYRAENDAPRGLMEAFTASRKPAYDFEAEDGVRHSLWVVDSAKDIAALSNAFAAVPYFYIADGHHRSAAAAAASKRTDAPGAGEFLAVVFPESELAILDYNRVVKDLNGHTPETFLEALTRNFTVESGAYRKPGDIGQFGLYMDGAWHNLTFKGPLPNDAVDGLAVSVLQNAVLSPVLGINDPQTDKRIDFVGGARGIDGLTSRVDSGEMAAAFTLFPTSMRELMAVADAGRIMPPKSTWFEPKLRSGLLIHGF